VLDGNYKQFVYLVNYWTQWDVLYNKIKKKMNICSLFSNIHNGMASIKTVLDEDLTNFYNLLPPSTPV